MNSPEKQLSTPATLQTASTITICALYKFVRLDAFEALREPLSNKMTSVEVKGTISC